MKKFVVPKLNIKSMIKQLMSPGDFRKPSMFVLSLVFGISVVFGFLLFRHNQGQGDLQTDWREVAREATANSDYAKSEEAYKKLIGSGQADGKIWQEIGFVYQMGKKQTEAIDAYEKAIGGGVIEAGTYNNLANLYRDKGDFANAEEAYKKSIEINPQFTLSVINLSHLYNLQKKYDQSVGLLTKYFDGTGKTANLGVQLASTYKLTGKTTEAKRVLNNILTSDSDNAAAKKMLENI